MQVVLNRDGHGVNRKRVARLLRVMGIQAIYPRRSLSQPAQDHQIYPYLLRDLEITGPNQVWCSDITYLPMRQGYMYLVAVMDWWSRYVLAWELSNTMEAEFCVRAWEQALARAGCAPLIFNTDQGSQFTSPGFIDAAQSAGTAVSMDGRGRWIDKGSSSGTGAVSNMRMFTSTTMATDSRRAGGWANGSPTTIKSARTRRLTDPRQRTGIGAPANTADNPQHGKRCGERACASAWMRREAKESATCRALKNFKRELEIRPPKAVKMETLKNGERGRRGRGAFAALSIQRREGQEKVNKTKQQWQTRKTLA